MKSFLVLCLVLIFSIVGLLPTVHVQSQTAGINSSASDIAWSPDGNVLAVSGNFGIELYNANNFQLIQMLTSQPTDILAWSPDGTLLASNSYSINPFAINLWDTQTSQVITTIPISTYVLTLAWSPNSQQLATIIDHGVEIYEVASQTLIFTLTSSSPIQDVSWSPDGTYIAAVGGGNTSIPHSQALINVWEADTGVLELSIDLTTTERFSNLFAMAWSPDSTEIALGIGISEKGSIPYLDIASQTISIGYVGPIDPINFMGWSPDGARFAASDDGSTGSTLTLWNATTYETSWFLYAPESGSYIGGAWKADSSQLAMLVRISTNNTLQTEVHILDASTGANVAILALPDVTPVTPTPVPINTPTATSTPDPCTFFPSNTADLVTAITTANSNSGLDTICLTQNGTYTFTSAHASLRALPSITSDIKIIGNGATLARQAGSAAFRFFEVASNGTLTLENLTLSGAEANAEPGGAILNTGNLTVNNVTFSGNHAGTGAAIDNHRFGGTSNPITATITNSTFENNTANYGAALDNDANATMTVTNSTFTGNVAVHDGGAIRNHGTLSLTDSQILNNTSGAGGSGVFSTGSTTTHNSCISGNTISVTSVVHVGSTAQDFAGNYWGAADGPSGAGGGSGDSVNHNINFADFLTSCPY